MSDFFALISRMRYISRWGLMRSSIPENVQEHSHMVAVLAHALGVIRRDIFKAPCDPGLLAAAALGGLALMAAAALLDLPGGITGLMCGMGGALLGLGGSSVIMGAVERHMSPQERKELQRSETDERNIAIREKAAQSSWYWTLYLLWVPFVISLVREETLWILLSSAVTVLHCVFYMVNMGRWAKKL